MTCAVDSDGRLWRPRREQGRPRKQERSAFPSCFRGRPGRARAGQSDRRQASVAAYVSYVSYVVISKALLVSKRAHGIDSCGTSCRHDRGDHGHDAKGRERGHERERINRRDANERRADERRRAGPPARTRRVRRFRPAEVIAGQRAPSRPGARRPWRRARQSRAGGARRGTPAPRRGRSGRATSASAAERADRDRDVSDAGSARARCATRRSRRQRTASAGRSRISVARRSADDRAGVGARIRRTSDVGGSAGIGRYMAGLGVAVGIVDRIGNHADDLDRAGGRSSTPSRVACNAETVDADDGCARNVPGDVASVSFTSGDRRAHIAADQESRQRGRAPAWCRTTRP